MPAQYTMKKKTGEKLYNELRASNKPIVQKKLYTHKRYRGVRIRIYKPLTPGGFSIHHVMAFEEKSNTKSEACRFSMADCKKFIDTLFKPRMFKVIKEKSIIEYCLCDSGITFNGELCIMCNGTGVIELLS